jgi:hypothetical protein
MPGKVEWETTAGAGGIDPVRGDVVGILASVVGNGERRA